MTRRNSDDRHLWRLPCAPLRQLMLDHMRRRRITTVELAVETRANLRTIHAILHEREFVHIDTADAILLHVSWGGLSDVWPDWFGPDAHAKPPAHNPPPRRDTIQRPLFDEVTA